MLKIRLFLTYILNIKKLVYAGFLNSHFDISKFNKFLIIRVFYYNSSAEIFIDDFFNDCEEDFMNIRHLFSNYTEKDFYKPIRLIILFRMFSYHVYSQ